MKISKKLLLGFGLIVIIFSIAIFIMRSYLDVVEESSDLLASKISVILKFSTKYNTQVHEVFITLRTIQYKENQDTIKLFKQKWADVQKTAEEMTEMNRMYPELLGPKYAVQYVLPAADKYADHANRALVLITKKQELLSKLIRVSGVLTTTSEHILAEIHKKLKYSIGRMYAGARQDDIQSITDAMLLSANLESSIMSIRKDTWRAYTDRSWDELIGLNDELKNIDTLAMNLKQILSNTLGLEKEIEKLIVELKDYMDYMSEFTKTCFQLGAVYRELSAVKDAFINECNVLNDMSVNHVQNVSNENIENLNIATFVMAALSILGVIFAIVIALLISQRISKPLNRIVSLAKRTRDGDMTIKKSDFDYEGKDEMGSMISALADTIENQCVTMISIVNIAEDLAEGARNLSAISEETNASMEEINASFLKTKKLSESNGTALEESNFGVEEMSIGADTVARSAVDSATFISQTTDASNNAINKVRNVIKGMHDVDKHSKASESKIQQLVLSVENVSSFVSIITGIADQTNLLALNAAIEAARAGEVGRGFAVVAEEVRKLAEESTQAAHNVNGIIEELQTDAQESIKATTNAGNLLASTLNRAEEALNELNDALNQIHKANDSIQNIAAIAEEQAASSKDVAQAIDNATKTSVRIVKTISNIHNATDKTALATEAVEKHAETMTKYASTLSKLVSNFKLSKSAANENILDKSVSKPRLGEAAPGRPDLRGTRSS